MGILGLGIWAYGGTQRATVSLNADAAAILLKESRIRIDWLICRICKKNNPTTCYRCLQGYILLEIKKGNLIACYARGITRNPPIISRGAESVRNF